MSNQHRARRKRRTREHVIADLSVHHLEGFILEAGHTVQRLSSDYGYDLLMSTFDEHGYAEPGSVYFQLKARETLVEHGGDYLYDLDVRDYNLWIREKMPVVLVMFDVSRGTAYWLAVQEYFRDGASRSPGTGAKRVRVRVPRRQRVSARAIAKIRQLKEAAIGEEKGQRP